MPEHFTHPPRSGVQILVEWANQQDHWVRAIVSEVLAARKGLPAQSIDAAYKMLLAEKALSKDAAPNVPALSVGVTTKETAEELRLVRLAGLTGVNALAGSQEIAFNPKLTILFGENAAGKTGYVRVLKRVASVRTAQPILGNINLTAAGKPHATIDYTLAGVAKSLDWNDDVGVPPFTRMSAFDSGAVSLHVDDDLTYIFTPGELALFKYVHSAVDAVKARLDGEKNEAQPKVTNPFLHLFLRDGTVYPLIETLGAATSISDLDALANVTPEEEKSLAVIKDRVDALQPRANDTRLQVATSDRDLFDSIRAVTDVANSFPWEKYEEGLEEVRKAEENYADASKTAFAGEDIPAIFGEAWQEFITAGEAYLRAIDAHEHPREGDRCPYCRQDLDAKAMVLVRKYRGFCNNEAKKALDSATEALKQLTTPLTEIALGTVKASCERSRAAFADPATAPALLAKAIEFLDHLKRAQASVAACHPVDKAPGFSIAAAEIAREASDAVARVERSIADMRKQASERKDALEEETAKLQLLENRLTLKRIVPDVRVYVERAQWAGRAAPLVNRIVAVLKALTEQSKLASQELLDKDFGRLFESERLALRAPKVQLDFAGRRGQAARKKVLVPDHRLSEILSEGEQKVIALADFLAEAGLHRTTAPVIFDDPVNSLDHRRIQEIARRIVALSSERQVVLFTHSILLVMEIVALLESAPSDFSYFSVEEIDGKVGIVTSGERPRLDTIGDLKSKINQLIQNAGTEAGEMRAALIEKAYELLRAWIEVFIQKELLAGVVERYSPHVRVTALGNIKLDRLQAADSVIRPLYEKICRCIASHSQPTPTLGVRPTLDELKQDWQSAQDARKAHGAK
jgi:predicted ATPase